MSMAEKTASRLTPTSTKNRSKNKKDLTLGNGTIDDKPVLAKFMSAGLENRRFNQYTPTINVAPLVFIHSGKDVPSYISDCTWLHDCYYTSLGISPTATEECVSFDSESESEDDTPNKTRVNDIFTNVASMVDLEKISDVNKLDIIRVNSLPSLTSRRSKNYLATGHCFSESESCLHSLHRRETEVQKTSKVTSTAQPLVLPNIDQQENSIMHSFHDTTDTKPPVMKSSIKTAWASPELPIKKIPQYMKDLKVPTSQVSH
eukprot:XP_011683214.1 PREDICTED: uncharacterized protein LOC105447164 [Strongylocentrotus purpuratus]